MNQKRRLNTLLKITAASWAVVCIMLFMLFPGRFSALHTSALDGAFSLPQKMAGMDFLKFALDLVVSFFAILTVFAAYVLCGLFFLAPILPGSELTNKENSLPFTIFISSYFLMGHWIYSIIFFTLAYFKSLTSLAVGSALLAGFLCGIPQGYRYFNKIRNGRSEEMREEAGYKTVNALSLILLFSALLLTASRLSYDSVYLYFSDPKATAVTHGLHFFHGNYFVISAFQTGIHFASLISLFGDQTARMYSWISGCVVILFSLGIANKAGLSGKAKSILLALILTTTAFSDLLGDGKVDLTSTAPIMAAIYWMMAEGDKRSPYIAGFFAGIAMSSRPYNIFLMAIFTGLLYLIRAYRDRNAPFSRQNFIKGLFQIGIGAIPPIALNLLANWVVFGTPLAMLVNNFNVNTGNWQWAFDPRYIWVIRFFLPFTATFLNTPQSLGGLSPIFLGFLPIFLFGEIRKKINIQQSLQDLLIVAFTTLVLWIFLFFTVMEIRYVFFLWILLFMPASMAVAFIFESNNFPLKKELVALVNILLIFSIIRTFYISFDTYSPIDAQGNGHCQDFDFCDYLRAINKNSPKGIRVMTLSAFRYYLRTDLLTCSTSGDEYQALREASLQSANAFWEEVYQQGYSYIAYEKNYSVRHLYIEFEPKPENTPSWMKIVPIYNAPGDQVVAYKINIIGDVPVPREKTCMQNNSIWEIKKIFPKS